MCGFHNVWVWVYVGFLMGGCVFVWVFLTCECVCVGFLMLVACICVFCNV